MENTKRCYRCKDVKPRTDFHKDSSRGDGIHPVCKPCRRSHRKLYYADIQGQRMRESYNPVEARQKRLFAKYGLSLEQYEEMAETLQNRCEICARSSEQLVVDHNHETGVVRGLLCNSCNMSLGGFQDSPAILESAARYLRDRGHFSEETLDTDSDDC